MKNYSYQERLRDWPYDARQPTQCGVVPIPELNKYGLKDEKEDKLKSSFLTGKRIFYFELSREGQSQSNPLPRE